MNSKLIGLGVVLVGAVMIGMYFQQAKQIATLRQEIANLSADYKAKQALVPRATIVAPYLARRAIAAAAQPPASTTTEGSTLEYSGQSSSSHTKGIGPSQQTPPSNEQWEEEERANQTAVEFAFASETIDRFWAPDTTRELQDQLTALLPASSSLREVDCRSSLCRVEIVHPDAEASNAFIQRTFMEHKEQTWDGPGMVMPAQMNSDGTVVVAVYLGREGDSLSRISPAQDMEGAGL